MRLKLGSAVRKLGWFLFFVVIVPAVTVATWEFSKLVFSGIEPWKLLLGILVFSCTFLLWLQLRAQAGITAHSAWESEFLHAQEKFEVLYENSPVPYVTVDRRGDVTMCNLAAVRLLGATTDELSGQSLTDALIGETDVDASVLSGKIASGAPVVDIERQIKTAEGGVKWVQVSVFAGSHRNERLVSMVDITHQKTIDQAKSEFVALAAHQLRTPIAAIRWNVELLRTTVGEQLGEKADAYIQKVERNVTRMNALSNDFLSVSKLETGTFASDAEDIQLPDFIATIIDEHQQAITQKQIRLETSFEPKQFVLNADARLMHIVVNNLLSNAVKYVEAEGAISLSYQADHGRVIIVIADTGIGVPASEQEKLFTKFYRASNAQTHRTEGTGLGLYIVKQSVEMLGGTINVVSEENVGTTFTVTLPAS